MANSEHLSTERDGCRRDETYAQLMNFMGTYLQKT